MKLLKILKRLFRPRLHHRYSVDNGVLVLIEPHAVAYRKVQMLDISKRNQVQMLNISEGGCAFIYDGSQERFGRIRSSEPSVQRYSLS
jgi:hypothetical protein